MSEDFKYLGNNPGVDHMPYLGNLDVQKTVTQFNFNVWGAGTKVYMCQVPSMWSSNYEHVVDFENEAARDAYLKQNAPVELTGVHQIKHDGTVDVPVPYEDAINYNYLMVEYPKQPVPEFGGQVRPARLKYFYFIEDVEYASPNATILHVTLDVWTTYKDEININSVYLERGHAPVANQAPVEQYIANPLENIIGLTTTDVTFGDLVSISNQHVNDLTQGERYYIIVTTADPTKIGYAPNPVFSLDENGQYNGPTDFANVEPVGTVPANDDDTQSGLWYIGVKHGDWVTLVSNIESQMPNFFQTIKGVLMCWEGFYAVESFPTFQFLGVTVYRVNSDISSEIRESMTKEDWGYDQKYDWLTKLYTYPYCMLQFTDPAGIDHYMKYEDLASGEFYVRLISMVCLANPSTNAYIMNVGMPGDSRQEKFSIPWPTTNINQSALSVYDLQNKWGKPMQYYSKSVEYGNNLSKMQTDREQYLLDQALQLQQILASSDMSKTLAMRENWKALLLYQMNYSANKERNAIQYATSKKQNEQSIDQISLQMQQQETQSGVSMVKASENKQMSDASTQLNTLNEIKSQGTWVEIPFLSSDRAASKALGASDSSASINLTPLLDKISFGDFSHRMEQQMTFDRANLAYQNNALTYSQIVRDIKTNLSLALSQLALQNDQLEAMYKLLWEDNILGVPQDFGGLNLYAFRLDNNQARAQIAISQFVDWAANGNTEESLTNISPEEIMGNNLANIDTPPDDDCSFMLQKNLNDSQNRASNQRNKDGYEAKYNVSLKMLRDALKLYLQGWNMQREAAKLGPPQSFGSISSIINRFPDKQYAIRWWIKTQSDDAIAKAGDHFLRFGYALDGNLQFVRWSLMKHFTYWKTHEVFLYAQNVNNRDIKIFQGILQKGVTVWRKPDEMGAVSIYDNTIQ